MTFPLAPLYINRAVAFVVVLVGFSVYLGASAVSRAIAYDRLDGRLVGTTAVCGVSSQDLEASQTLAADPAWGQDQLGNCDAARRFVKDFNRSRSGGGTAYVYDTHVATIRYVTSASGRVHEQTVPVDSALKYERLPPMGGIVPVYVSKFDPRQTEINL